jgi:hypothetical protein
MRRKFSELGTTDPSVPKDENSINRLKEELRGV